MGSFEFIIYFGYQVHCTYMYGQSEIYDWQNMEDRCKIGCEKGTKCTM